MAGPLVLASQLAGVVAGAILVKSAMDGTNPMAGGGGLPRCATCNGTGRVACLCARWSDGDNTGCRTCSGSGRMVCSSCGGTGTGRPIPMQIQMRPNPPSTPPTQG
ncbi:Drought-induced protein [Zostera marina]|uniref:Drought-induced protein n=1 Tax=Zostera marina TaxID=29655 RepID=A0A0K9PW71_ZOSMR|nr:Drought-induced protein [Zostera marina]